MRHLYTPLLLPIMLLLALSSAWGQSLRISLPVERYIREFNTMTSSQRLDRFTETRVYSALPENPYVETYGGHPLLAACHLAYAQHQGFVLSPEAFWVTVMQGAGLHVQLNTGKLKDKFTNKDERIPIDLLLPSGSVNWPDILRQLTDSVLQHVPESWAGVAGNTFSTTTPLHTSVFELAFLDIADSYFFFRGNMICGIPEIEITGTVDDWRKIKRQISFLQVIDMDWWLDKLNVILDQVLVAYAGDTDTEFWCRMFKIEKDGCVDPYVSGWMAHLIPYVKIKGKHEYVVNRMLLEDRDFSRYYKMDNFPNGYSEIEFTLNQQVYCIKGGLMGTVLTEDKNLKPELGWFVSVKDKN